MLQLKERRPAVAALHSVRKMTIGNLLADLRARTDVSAELRQRLGSFEAHAKKLFESGATTSNERCS